MIIPFGNKYLNDSVDFVLELDPNYLIWASKQKNIISKYPEVISYIKLKLESLPVPAEDSSLMQFGKYCFQPIEKVVLADKSYAKWLLKKASFLEEYPETHGKLKQYYALVYENIIDKNNLLFYVLKFKNRDYIKPGITSQYIVRRIYNYAGIMNVYREDNIDIKESFVYLTDDLRIEKNVLSFFSDKKYDRKTERLNCNVEDVDEFILSEKNTNFYYRKKCLYNFIPYKDSFAFRDSFILKIDQFTDFENLYLEHLKRENLYEYYEPNFVGWNPN